MKIGIISDVHSNIDALKVAFDVFEEEKVEKIISAGDVIGIGPYPRECVDFCMQNKDKFLAFVRGNHEGYLLKGIPKRLNNKKNGRILTFEEKSLYLWNNSHLREDQIAFIKHWEKSAKLEVEGKTILVEHYPMNSMGNYKKFYKIPTEEQIDSILEDKSINIYIFGHTHEDIYYNNNNTVYINPGSLGCPVKTGGANFGILDVNSSHITYKQFTAKYDVDKTINDINTLAYPIHKALIHIFYNNKL